METPAGVAVEAAAAKTLREVVTWGEEEEEAVILEGGVTWEEEVIWAVESTVGLLTLVKLRLSKSFGEQ